MSRPSNEVATAFIAAINAHDPAAVRALMTADHTFTDSLGNSFSGADKMFAGWQHFFHAYPDYRITVEQSFAEESHVALFGTAEGGWRVNEAVLPQRWKVRAAWLAEVDADKIKRWSVFCDTGWAKPPG